MSRDRPPTRADVHREILAIVCRSGAPKFPAAFVLYHSADLAETVSQMLAGRADYNPNDSNIDPLRYVPIEAVACADYPNRLWRLEVCTRPASDPANRREAEYRAVESLRRDE